MMKPAGAGAGPGTGTVEVRVERPQRPPVHPNPARLRARPYYRRWTPWLVPAASIACVAVFLVTMFVNDCPNRSAGNCTAGFLGRFAFQPLKENPLLGPSSTTLLKMGALDVSKVVQGRQGWRLITCIWLHAGVVHLLINVLCLLFIGIRLEQEFGFVRIGLVYLISGFGGSLMSALFIRASISVGASGALFGLIGSMLSELITNWSLYANKFAWINQRRVAPGPQAAPAERKHKTYQYILWIVAAILLIVGFTVAIVLLFRGYNANDHCSWCHYLSCVPTKKWKCNSSPTTCTVR
ncbi:hypothetical protein ACQJBY_032384 [Aegilops geniculata]